MKWIEALKKFNVVKGNGVFQEKEHENTKKC